MCKVLGCKEGERAAKSRGVALSQGGRVFLAKTEEWSDLQLVFQITFAS